MLMYRRSDSLHIEGYSDSDFIGDVDDRKSTSGYVFTLAGGAISWKSSKQIVTTSSMMYAKFVACYESTGQVNWLKKFMPGLKVVMIFIDHSSCTAAMSQQYVILTTISQVVLPNTLI